MCCLSQKLYILTLSYIHTQQIPLSDILYLRYLSYYERGSIKCNISYNLFMVPFMKLYLYYYFLSYIIKVSSFVFQPGIYNSFGKIDLVVTIHKKSKDI